MLSTVSNNGLELPNNNCQNQTQQFYATSTPFEYQILVHQQWQPPVPNEQQQQCQMEKAAEGNDGIPHGENEEANQRQRQQQQQQQEYIVTCLKPQQCPPSSSIPSSSSMPSASAAALTSALFECSQCGRPITEGHLAKISPDRYLHECCARCSICHCPLLLISSSSSSSPTAQTCFEREGRLYCQMDYIQQFRYLLPSSSCFAASSPPNLLCAGCQQAIQANDFVYKLKHGIFYHIRCHCCACCGRPLAQGEQIVVDGRSRAVACATHFLGGQTAAETAASFNWANGAICADTSINRFSMAKGQEIITMGNGRTRGPNGQQQQGIGQMGQPTKWPKLPNNSAAFAAANDDDDRNGTLVDMLEMGQKEAKIGQEMALQYEGQFAGQYRDCQQLALAQQDPLMDIGEGTMQKSPATLAFSAPITSTVFSAPSSMMASTSVQIGGGQYRQVGFFSKPINPQQEKQQPQLCQPSTSQIRTSQIHRNSNERGGERLAADGHPLKPIIQYPIVPLEEADNCPQFGHSQICQNECPTIPRIRGKMEEGESAVEKMAKNKKQKTAVCTGNPNKSETAESSNLLEGAVLTTLQNIKAAFGEWQKVEIAEEEQQQHQQPMKGVGKAKKRKGDPSNGRTTTTKRMTTSSTPPLAVPQYPFEMYAVGEQFSRQEEESQQKAQGNKRRGPRTTISQQQLDILNHIFATTPKPSKHARAKLAMDAGLSMRVIQVWFQNRRSKERRLKHLCNFLRHCDGSGPTTHSTMEEVQEGSEQEEALREEEEDEEEEEEEEGGEEHLPHLHQQQHHKQQQQQQPLQEICVTRAIKQEELSEFDDPEGGGQMISEFD